MAEQDDVLHLIDDTGHAPEASSARKWKVAVIDDDSAVHEGTRFALSDYNLNGATLEILSAYSAAEGRKLMREHPDADTILLPSPHWPTAFAIDPLEKEFGVNVMTAHQAIVWDALRRCGVNDRITGFGRLFREF